MTFLIAWTPFLCCLWTLDGLLISLESENATTAITKEDASTITAASITMNSVSVITTQEPTGNSTLNASVLNPIITVHSMDLNVTEIPTKLTSTPDVKSLAMTNTTATLPLSQTIVQDEVNTKSLFTASNATMNTAYSSAKAAQQYVGSCSSDPVLCCPGLNSSCHKGCYCDEHCLTAHDCCPDYNETCNAGTTTGTPSTLTTVYPSASNRTTETIPSTIITSSTSNVVTSGQQSTISHSLTTGGNNTTETTQQSAATTGTTTGTPSTLTTVYSSASNRTTETIPSTIITSSTSNVMTSGQQSTISHSLTTGGSNTNKTTQQAPATSEVLKNLTVLNITTTSITLSWQKSEASASSFLIQILGDPTYNRNVTTTNYTIEGLIPGNIYTILVSALVSNVKVKNSSICICTKPESVINLRASNISVDSVNLSWEAPVGNRSSYIINIIGDPLFIKKTVYESITIGNLTVGNIYLFRVSVLAGDDTVQGNSKEISVTTYQASLYISLQVSTLLSKPEREQQIIFQVNKFLQTTFPNQNVTVILKAERT
ncbi:uncharacterized protein LOC142142776 [Mixophyes fleayi]|uniref:uncharacterized protein LOC142142776 n=1 Tax=Mixophyes fleayi TaxID=3061075 RepID=UPI003F4E0289